MNIAIIPARHGSKSILNKNLQKIGTKSLVERTIKSAIESGIFTKTILTTDIPFLLEEYKDNPLLTIHERPKNLCTDEAEMQGVIMNCINTYGLWKDARIWLLQPTSPFRHRSDYQNILEIFKTSDTQSVISVYNVRAAHPNRMYTVKDNMLYPIRYTSFANKQNLPDVYLRSGHYYVFNTQTFKDEMKFYLRPCRPYFMNHMRGRVNIDDPEDLQIAKMLHKEGLCQ